MATFRTDPDTGRTVISSDNIVRDDGMTDRERGMTAGQRVDNRISGGDPRGGYEGMNAPTRAGTGYMSRSEFEAVSGMTDTNPYGNDGIFSRVFGIDPSKIDYTSNLGARGIENVKRQAYDRFMNPFARVDAFGRPTLGADPAAGTTRSGVQPGDLTVFGPAIESRQDGIAGLFQNTMLGAMMPKRARITGYDTNVLVPELRLGGPQPGEGVDPAQRFGAQSAVDYSGMGNEILSANPPRVDERLTPMSFPGNVDDLGNELGAFPEPEDPFAFEDRKGRVAPADILFEDFKTRRTATEEDFPTVAEILMQEPPAASITVDRPRVTDRAPVTLPSQSQSAPSVVFPEEPGPVNLLEDILAPDGSILPGVMDVISPPQTQRTGGRDIILVMPDGRVIDSRNVGQ
mgnify:CR=1 FL=1|tara:strand:- start:331 stop:1536 length:1206 start_codon:yes stop_codon:yes gene_type:complete